MENIVLIGMPGVGKSTIGVILAKVLGYEFVDADLLIQKEEGRKLREIIEIEGTAGFIEIEGRVNSRIQGNRTVIATGGSVVYSENAMKHLSSLGTIVYLQLSYEELAVRLGNLRGRGVVLLEGQTLQDLYKERIPLYEKYAHITVNEEGLEPEETLEKIIESLDKGIEK
jgi:shikimate kinase